MSKEGDILQSKLFLSNKKTNVIMDLREKLNVSQEEFAEMCSVTRRMVIEWEFGIDPTWYSRATRFQELCQKAGMDFEEFLFKLSYQRERRKRWEDLIQRSEEHLSAKLQKPRNRKKKQITD